MNATLSLSESMLTMARDLQAVGRLRDAANILKRLVKFRDLKAAITEEAHARLAELCIQSKQYREARRCLAVAMVCKPSCAKYYHQFALCLQNDPAGADPRRARRYFRKAVDLDPAITKYWSDMGQFLIEIGKTKSAVRALKEAVAINQDDVVSIRRLVEALCLAERPGQARRLLREARFRHPRDGKFQKLWSDFQFQSARRGQVKTQTADEPVLLPFVAREVLPFPTNMKGKIVRFDRPSRPTKPHNQAAVPFDPNHAS